MRKTGLRKRPHFREGWKIGRWKPKKAERSRACRVSEVKSEKCNFPKQRYKAVSNVVNRSIN
jgi:hypothetical protein